MRDIIADEDDEPQRRDEGGEDRREAQRAPARQPGIGQARLRRRRRAAGPRRRRRARTHFDRTMLAACAGETATFLTFIEDP